MACALHIGQKRQQSTWSYLGHAAVDEEFNASDVATFVGSEEGDHFGYFIQRSGATKRPVWETGRAFG